MEQLKKNTVKAENQLDIGNYITFIGNKGLRVMFAGNSITRHGPNKEIGWNNDWGMAASDIEKDYVHILMKKIKDKTEASFCINQVSGWEMNYKNPDKVMERYIPAQEFNADIIVVRFIENCSPEEFDRSAFKREYERFIRFLDKSERAKIIITTSFWHHPGDDIVIDFAKTNGYPLVDINDLGEKDEMKAIGLFEHSGVAQHPGDLGMQTIADRIWEEIEKII